jgi:hypothetical protein
MTTEFPRTSAGPTERMARTAGSSRRDTPTTPIGTRRACSSRGVTAAQPEQVRDQCAGHVKLPDRRADLDVGLRRDRPRLTHDPLHDLGPVALERSPARRDRDAR